MNIIARISTCAGIGHLMRMKWLLHEFMLRNYKLSLILDESSVDVSYLLKDIKCELYYVETNSKSDLGVVQSVIESVRPDFIFIDHYELGFKYEVELQAFGGKVVVFDDLANSHYCDFLFDAKWQGSETSKRYENKLPERARIYQGPEFALLSPEYSNIEYKKESDDEKRQILLSLGGGGDLALFAGLLSAIPKLLLKTLRISVVVGPQAQNRHILDSICYNMPEVTLLEAPLSLAKHYAECDLFIGALGTSLYELAALQVPSITFSIAKNQHNELSHLEALGHFFHLDSIDLTQMKRLGENVANFLNALPRIADMRKQSSLVVDGVGVQRVANILTGTEYNTRARTVDRYVHAYKHLSSDVSVRPVFDGDINDYLVARNKPSNAKRMTVKEPIERLTHYLWWFNNNRHSYAVEHNGKVIAYIWHQLYRQDNAEYLYGGWFTADEDVPFNIAILILQWQLDFCSELNPQAHWLAVIHKENKFVNLLNRYMGFVETPVDSSFYVATQSLFPNADAQFNFVMRYANE
ncbi:UDP-2,4-diacetamido-2,4,6-trideoxy-beta-L-altropyranose hydrolase [Pseudoalteromonas sp. MMG005]|uniref:UDP-2,4-diacetamido-2,4, 6-trideoxy-beta-L-altropyranose hydrolase n=1 Tax=Pseudoalteromonas sp. MMG005 TaxID=2822682 RepID=UPI001B3A5396|nr:UDP-2,4-diacetamido-2,4,6-trideoxy-beta-L-altropyranose hydrolase [Pseudoalteromonas sp. MMG005]MBQ4846340.1 UDP-2,4-diacetamido-2,4,6-trideoxy-beta-L-altropyranose hydrolase [Pseudoalteromonas sp. MMG005]